MFSEVTGGNNVKKHLGSTIAIIIGVLSLVSGLANPGSLLVAGPIIILGALAYRSAKKRWLGEAQQSLLRKSLEATAMVAIVAAVLLHNNLAALIVSDTVPNLIIPLWAVSAYSIIAFKKRRTVGEVNGLTCLTTGSCGRRKQDAMFPETTVAGSAQPGRWAAL